MEDKEMGKRTWRWNCKNNFKRSSKWNWRSTKRRIRRRGRGVGGGFGWGIGGRVGEILSRMIWSRGILGEEKAKQR